MDGEIKGDWEKFSNEKERDQSSNIECGCGNYRFFVNFIQSPNGGCFVKIFCPNCRKAKVLHDTP